MAWAILIVLVLIFAQLCLLGAKLGAIWTIIRTASDLNLEAHERLLEEVRDQGRTVSRVFKGR